MSKRTSTWAQTFWDIWCVASIIGIWPRFIEPESLSVTQLSIPISKLPAALQGLKILQFSDLHWSLAFSSRLKKKLIRKINRLQPDLIVFTGDLLSRSHLEDSEGLQSLLSSLKAKIGCFAVLGNHDYEQFITINEQGDYDIDQPSAHSDISKGFKRLFSSIHPSKQATDAAKHVRLHAGLIELLQKTPFQLLHNQTVLVPYQDTFINICGIGEYSAGQMDIDRTFESYHKHYPGIVLAHNPDAIPQLSTCPGNLILCGHTHGGQINLPWMWKKFTYMEHPQFKHGLYQCGRHWSYVNRGIGSVMPFRWFSLPELTLITLKDSET